MITFVRNPEIQLFTDFIKRFEDAELLRNRMERITVVLPEDSLAGAFWDSEPFAFNRAINNGSGKFSIEVQKSEGGSGLIIYT